MYQRNLVATSKLDADGKPKLMLNIPVDLRRAMELEAGEQVKIEPKNKDVFTVTRVKNE